MGGPFVSGLRATGSDADFDAGFGETERVAADVGAGAGTDVLQEVIVDDLLYDRNERTDETEGIVMVERLRTGVPS